MKKKLNNPWIIGIATTLLGFILSVIYDISKKYPVFSTIRSFFGLICNAVVSFFSISFTVKVWWLLAAVLVLVLLRVVLKKTSEKKPQKTHSSDFLLYTKDTIQGWNWEWTYRLNGMGQYTIDDLYPICQQCGTPLVKGKTYSETCVCPRCNLSYKKQLPDLEDVHLLISDNIKRGLYSKPEDGQSET